MSGSRANPYPGPRAFEAEDSGRFFGRATEIHQLRGLAVARRVVLLYAASGAGKTSLLSAGLVPYLRQTLPGARIFPVARVSGDPPAGLEVADAHVWNVLSAILEEGAGPAEIAGLTLRQGVERLLAGEAPEEGPPPAFLILDQLEELFQDGRGDPRTFFLQLRDALEARPELSLILALREDSLAQLDPYKILLPDELRTRYRLDLLGPEAALSAVEGPARDAGVPFAPGAAHQLVDDLRRSLAGSPEGTAREAPGSWVDPVQLQVVCHRIWASLPEGAAEIDETRAHAVGSFDEILARHYDERLRDVERETGVPEKALRRWIDQLITTQGLRDQVPQEPGATRGLDNRAVKALVDTHLVRAERRRGMVWYELGHDRMVRPVQSANHAWRERDPSPAARLHRRALLWQSEGQPRRLLVLGRTLKRAQRALDESGDEIPPPGSEFLAACHRAQQRRRTLRFWLIIGGGSTLGLAAFVCAFLGVVAVIAFGWWASLSDLGRRVAQEREEHLDRALVAALQAREVGRVFESHPEVARKLLESTPGTLDHRGLLSSALEASPQLVTFLHAAGHRPVRLTWSRDGRWLTAAGSTGRSLRWDLAKVPPDGPAVASSLEAGSIVVPVAAAGRPPARLPTDAIGPVSLLAPSPSGRWLAAGGPGGTIALWDLRDGEPSLTLLRGESAPLRSLAWRPDDRLLASGHDGGVVLWNPAAGPRLRESRPLAAGLDRAAFRPGGAALASLHRDPARGTAVVRRFDAAARPLGPPIDTGEISALALSPDGRLLAGGRDGGELAVWDTSSGTSRPESSDGPAQRVTALAFDPPGRALASGHRDGSVVLRDLGDLAPRSAAHRGHAAPVTALAFSDRGETLVSGAEDGTLLTWSVPRGQVQGAPRRVCSGPLWSLAIHAADDGSPVIAAGCDDGTVQILRHGADALPLDGTPAPVRPGPVRHLAFSPGGRLLALALWDGAIELWDPATRVRIAGPVHGHRGPIAAIAFAEGGRRLLTAGVDGRLVRWDVDPASWGTLACRIANRNPNRAEWRLFMGFLQIYDVTCCPEAPDAAEAVRATRLAMED